MPPRTSLIPGMPLGMHPMLVIGPRRPSMINEVGEDEELDAGFEFGEDPLHGLGDLLGLLLGSPAMDGFMNPSAMPGLPPGVSSIEQRHIRIGPDGISVRQQSDKFVELPRDQIHPEVLSKLTQEFALARTIKDCTTAAKSLRDAADRLNQEAEEEAIQLEFDLWNRYDHYGTRGLRLVNTNGDWSLSNGGDLNERLPESKDHMAFFARQDAIRQKIENAALKSKTASEYELRVRHQPTLLRSYRQQSDRAMATHMPELRQKLSTGEARLLSDQDGNPVIMVREVVDTTTDELSPRDRKIIAAMLEGDERASLLPASMRQALGLEPPAAIEASSTETEADETRNRRALRRRDGGRRGKGKKR